MDYAKLQKLINQYTFEGNVEQLNIIHDKLKAAPEEEAQIMAYMMTNNFESASMNAQAKAIASQPQQ